MTTSDASGGGEIAPSATTDSEEPLPPSVIVSSDDELRAAVGASPRPRPDPQRAHPPSDHDAPDPDEPKPPRNWRAIMVGASAIMIGLLIATFIFLGRANSDRLLLVCDAEHITAEQGRGFPPWGTRALSGPAWVPIAIRPESACTTRDTESSAELAGWYLDALVGQAAARLTAREVTDYDVAYAQLQQALLLARDPDRPERRKEIERLLGDVDYWRATHAARKAADDLATIAKQYDSATAQQPRYVTDAAAWAAHVHHVVDELRAGPNGAPSVAFPAPVAATPEHGTPPPPLGSALPVEPNAGSGSAAEPPPLAPEATPDAGVPTGGVLL